MADLEVRYARVLAEHGWDAAVIHSGSPVKRSAFDDQYWPLRPVPHWQHWLPLAEPDCALIVRHAARPKLVVLRNRSFWEKPAPPVTRAFLDVFDVATVDQLLFLDAVNERTPQLQGQGVLSFMRLIAAG